MNRLRTWIAATLTGLAVATTIVACGGTRAAKSAAAPTAEAMPPPGTAGGAASPQDEIAQLEAEIKTSLDRINVTPPLVVPGAPPDPRPMAQVQGICKPPAQQNQTCRDVCTLSDSICNAASRICELSDQLVGDTDAAGKCQKGKKSCEAAQQRCCDCR